MSEQVVTLSAASARIVLEALDICTRERGLRAAAVLLPIAQQIEAQLAQPPAEE